MVPGEAAVPVARKAAAPSRRMAGTLASVSTLLVTVGLGEPGRANSPTRYGRRILGSGSEPSTTSAAAFSSPNRYSPGPGTMLTGAGPVMPAPVISRMARASASISRVKLRLMTMKAARAPMA